MKSIPVSLGQEVSLICESLNPRTQDGIFRYKGFVIIVKDTKPFFKYRIRVNKILSNLAFGDII